MKRILLITKTPMVAKLEPAVVARMSANGALDSERLKRAADNHERTLAAVRKTLSAHKVSEWQVDRLQPRDADGKDLVVTVGGDGTVLTANSLEGDVPMITVNSDPGGSIGMYTRCTAETFPALFNAWLSDSAQVEIIPRLQARFDGGSVWRVLNECLFASANPAAMTRYLIEVDGQREIQRSSGVWVATASGSTAAIRSAGMDVIEAHTPALLFKVREPFHGGSHGIGGAPYRILDSKQLPPRGVKLVASMPGISIFIDGPHIHRPVPPGSAVEISASPTPLRLLMLA